MPVRIARPLLAILLMVASLSSVSRAETLELVNGGRIVGTLLNPDEAPRKTYVVEAYGGKITLGSHQVTGLAAKSEAELWYETWLPKMPPDVAGNLRMAELCKERGLEAQRIFHLEQVLSLDPEHVEARRALGYSHIDGNWVHADVYFRQRGYVRHKGRWVLPQELALEAAKEEQEAAERAWSKNIRMWRSWALKRREKGPEGLANIRAINDPAAAATLIELLNEKDEPSQLKLLYIDVLAPMPGGAVTTELARRAILDPDAKVRERALEQLAKRGDKLAVRLFVNSLKDSDNTVVNRAAAALAHLQDPEAAPALIEALVTKHKFQVGGGAQMNPTFSNDGLGGGGGGLSMGGKPRIVVKEIQNVTVRDALLTLFPGINYGFDKAAWKKWLTQQTMPVSVNLRRDL